MIAELITWVAETPPQAGSRYSDLIVAALGAGGLGAIAAAVVTGLFSKRKLGAEATEIITKAAAGVVTNLENDVKRSRAELEAERTKHESEMSKMRADMAAMAAAHVAERQEWKNVLQLHVSWDAIAIAKVNELAVRVGEADLQLPAAPPLMPPVRYVDDDGYPKAGTIKA